MEILQFPFMSKIRKLYLSFLVVAFGQNLVMYYMWPLEHRKCILKLVNPMLSLREDTVEVVV